MCYKMQTDLKHHEYVMHVSRAVCVMKKIDLMQVLKSHIALQ